MTTTDYLSRELRRARISLHRAEKKPNTPDSEMQGLRDKIACLEEALAAVQWRDLAEKPLTMEQLMEMDNSPVWIVEYPDWGHWELSEDANDYIAERNTDFYNLRHNDPEGKFGLHKLGWLAYAYAPPHLGRDAWSCELCKDARFVSGTAYSEAIDDKGREFSTTYSDEGADCDFHYCPHCGRPLTDAAWAELERRMQG